MTLDSVHRPVVLTDAAKALYVRITREEPVGPDDKDALEELRHWLLVTEDPAHAGVPVALDPQEAGRRRLQAGLMRLSERAQQMAQLPALGDELSVHYARSRWQFGRGSEFLAEPGEVNARIEDALAQASTELLTAQPNGPRSRELLQIAVDRDRQALERGVSVRTLYRDSVRDDPVTREWAQTMSAYGAHFRTLPSPFQRCIVIDGRQAFISDHVVDGAAPHAAWHVKDRAMVAFIVEVFDDAWRRAIVWHGQPRAHTAPPEGVRTTRIQREILRGLAAGLDQRIVGERLGISLRSVSTELGKLKELWGAPSVPALTYLWAKSRDIHVDDDGPAGFGPQGAA